MKAKISSILKSKFLKNVFIMATGTIAAQLISILLSPIITRIYGPETFGIMGTFIAMVNVIIPISALTYPIAIVLPESDQDAKGLFKLSTIITFLMSVISLSILIFLKDNIISLFNLKEISPYLYLIPIVIMFSGIMQSMEQWLIRKKRFSINAQTTLYQSIINNGGKAVVGLLHSSASVLVIFTALNNGVKAFLMWFFSSKQLQKDNEYINNISSSINKKNLKELAQEYYDFPSFRAPETFLNAISQGLPVLMLTSFFGPASAGFYTIGRTVLRIPGRIIGKAVGDVFYPRISEAAIKKENITLIIKKATLVLAGLGIIPFGIVIAFGPLLFSFVFGDDWSTAGEYARWIALWTYFGFINRPSVRSLPVLKAQRFHLFYTVFMLITRVVVLAIGYYVFSSDLIAVALFGISGALLNIGLIVVSLKISKKKFVF